MAKVLIVEDDVTLSNLIAEVLSADEHSVDVFNDGELGAAQLCSGQYELAVLDWDLPNKNGIDICRAYRESGGKSPVLMLTGRGTVNEKEAAFDAGADDYLTKPFSLKELRARIRALLRRTTEYSLPASVQQAAKGPSTAPTAMKKSCSKCEEHYSASEEVCPKDGTRLTLSKADTLVGTTLDGRYTVLSRVGTGGLAIVYKATHERLRRSVAIKVLQSTVFFEDPEAIQRLEQEAVAVGQLHHPNIITVYDFGVTSDGLPYLVMDFVEGLTLSEVMNRDVRIQPLSRAIDLFKQMCDGMAHAHAAGLVHRDLKPGNIMLIKDAQGKETVKILDFGLAKILPESGLEFDKLTKSGDAIGTSYYMSPEQCRGAQIDLRSDVYSLGCVMHEMLTGLPPIKAANPLATIQAHVFQPPPALSATRPDLSFPEDLESLVLKTLQKDVTKRYQSMLELKRDLERIKT
jgi:DNA-binding response OmpR family regulator